MNNTQDCELRFDDPAKPFPSPVTLEYFAEVLRKSMGEWALLGRCRSSGTAGQRAYLIRHGLQPGFEPAGSFEAESKTLFGEARVYARFVGPG